MQPTTRPYRSVLYIPGSKERALEKARTLACDAIIFDLEDAVAPDAKEQARETLAAALREGGYGVRAKIIRINALDTPWGRDDVAALSDVGGDAILLPKASSAQDINELAALLPGDMPIWAMIESPSGILNAGEIAAHPRLEGLVAGTNDLAKDLHTHSRADRLPLMLSLQMIVLAARAAGKVAVDGVYNKFKDEEGLRGECEQGLDLGFDGKTLIHPAQLAIANEIFVPGQEALDLARRQIAAYEESEAAGQGVAVVDGAIVENLHVEVARALIAKADAIAKIEVGS